MSVFTTTPEQDILTARGIERISDDRMGTRSRARGLCCHEKTVLVIVVPKPSTLTGIAHSGIPVTNSREMAPRLLCRHPSFRWMRRRTQAVIYSHFEVRCSDEIRRSVPDRPRKTTLWVYKKSPSRRTPETSSPLVTPVATKIAFWPFTSSSASYT